MKKALLFTTLFLAGIASAQIKRQGFKPIVTGSKVTVIITLKAADGGATTSFPDLKYNKQAVLDI